jgi:hypothetical protein
MFDETNNGARQQNIILTSKTPGQQPLAAMNSTQRVSWGTTTEES